MALTAVLALLGTICILGYLYVKMIYSYWSDRGVPHLKPVFPIGNLVGFGFSKGTGQVIRDIYMELRHHKTPIVGMYFFTQPAVIVTDVEFAKQMLVKDFDKFHDRGLYHNEREDPLSANLVNLEGHKWKSLRQKLTPTFTSGKLKFMHSTLLVVADRFKDHLAKQGGEVEIKELLAQFTTDIIGSVAFGLELNSISETETEFRKYGKEIFANTKFKAFKRLLAFAFPKLAFRMNIRLNSPELTDFFFKCIRETVAYREENKVSRNDFLQLLMQLRETGVTSDPEEKLSFPEMVAQAFVFFAGGFETSSSTMTFACYELAWHQEVQDRVREEIQEVLKRHNGVLTYEAAMELTYLDKVVSETLRKYPIGTLLRRECNQTYKIPESDIVLDKGMIAFISVLGIQNDPNIWEEPDKFDPERFTKEAIANRHSYSYLPFGKGPRECIGMRLALMQTKVGLATVLRNFRLVPTHNTPKELVYDPTSALLGIVGGMPIGLQEIKE